MQQFLSNPVHLGHLLTSARRRKGFTQARAAAHVGISQSRLSVLESDPGVITVAQLMALTALYGLRIALDDKTAAVPKAEW